MEDEEEEEEEAFVRREVVDSAQVAPSSDLSLLPSLFTFNHLLPLFF
jgi:hypothetical protein